MKLCCTNCKVRADLPTPPSPSTTMRYLHTIGLNHLLIKYLPTQPSPSTTMRYLHKIGLHYLLFTKWFACARVPKMPGTLQRMKPETSRQSLWPLLPTLLLLYYLPTVYARLVLCTFNKWLISSYYKYNQQYCVIILVHRRKAITSIMMCSNSWQLNDRGDIL